MPNQNLPSCMLVDIEGTMSNNSHRLALLPPKDITGPAAERAWDRYYAGLARDPGYTRLINTCCAFNDRLRIMVVTGIPEKFRAMVEAWLNHEGVRYSRLFMRPRNNVQPNEEIKRRYLEQLRAIRMPPIMGIDDDKSVLDMYRQMKITNTLLAEQGKLFRYYGPDKPKDATADNALANGLVMPINL